MDQILFDFISTLKHNFNNENSIRFAENIFNEVDNFCKWSENVVLLQRDL